jgi:hypothetical protein
MTTPDDHAKAHRFPDHIDRKGVGHYITLREALELIAESNDAGRHDGKPEPCPVHDADTMFAVARRALDAYREAPSPPTGGILERLRAAKDGYIMGNIKIADVLALIEAPSPPEQKLPENWLATELASIKACPTCGQLCDVSRLALAPSPAASVEAMAKEFIETIADRENFTDDEWQSFTNKICAFAARVAAEQWEKFREAVDVAEWLSRKWGDPNGTVEQQAVWDHSMNRILPRLRAAIRQSASEG